jgi:hypothetical protein
MVFPPGQGKSGPHLMQLWRQYLEQYAENESHVEEQIVVGSYHAVEVLASLSSTLDRDGKLKDLIDERAQFFREGSRRAVIFNDHLLNATFGLYNQLNTLYRQFTGGHEAATGLLRRIEEQVAVQTRTADPVGCSAAALRAAFPLLSVMTLIIDRGGSITAAIRQVEQRFAAGSSRATTDWDQLLNALYRMVEMMQLLVVLSDSELSGQVDQIASRFQEEDQPAEMRLKLRNGFCRFFELAHLLTTHLDEIL